MTNSFWRFIYTNFSIKHGTLLSLIALLVSVLLWLFTPQSVVSLGIVFFFIVFSIFLIILFGDAAHEMFILHKEVSKDYENYKKNIIVSPEVISVKSSEDQILLYLKPSEFFSENMLVSIYYSDETGFEDLIGFGIVVNIQQNKNIHVELYNYLEAKKESIERIVQDTAILDRVIIKSHISKRILEIDS